MHEAYTRTGKITYVGGHTDDELSCIELEMQGIPVHVTLEKDGFKSTVKTFEQSGSIKLNISFEYESDALTALDAIIAAAFEAKRAIESRHKNMAIDLKTWANELKATQKRCRACNSTENLEAHHLESKHYSPSLMLSLGNGVVLCDKCHDDFHAFCGTKKASRRDFHEWLQARTKGKTFSSATKNQSKLVKLEHLDKKIRKTTAEEIARVKEWVLRFEKENGRRPGRPTLIELAGCSDYVARLVLDELNQSG
jgi:hypothetical protein